MPPPMQTLQFPHPQQRRHSSHTTSRYYGSISDDSLNRSRRESFAGMYASSSSPPMRRLSASSLLEERCQMGYQIPIDPRYRDTRPIARSASSLYNMSKEVSLSTHNLTNTLGGGMMMQQQHADPYSHATPQQYHHLHHPQMHINPLRKRARSISNTNINNTPPPSIYIEEYMEPGEQSSAAKTNSQESFTNFVYTEVHQPLNEEGLASVSNPEEIPFIDDGSPTEEEKPYVPLPTPPQNKSIISNRKSSSSSLINQRKTVSFDLEENNSRPEEVEASINRKFHTHDAISNFCRESSSRESLVRDSNSSLDKDKDKEKVSLIHKIRRELNSYRSTSGGQDCNNSGGSNSNSNRSSSESIEKMPLLTQRFREISIPAKRELNSIRSTSSSAGNPSYNGYNKIQQQQQQLLQKRFTNNTNVTTFKRDQVILHANRTTQNVNTTTATTILKTSPKNIPKINHTSNTSNVTPILTKPPTTESPLKEKSLSHSNILDRDYIEFKEFSRPYGQGKVKEMADFFTTNKDFKLQPFASNATNDGFTASPRPRLSKSTSDLLESNSNSRKTKPLLSENEQSDILKQLKEWSIFGLEGRDFDVNLKNANAGNSNSSIQTNETKQRINLNNCCFNNCYTNNNNHACAIKTKSPMSSPLLLSPPLSKPCKLLKSSLSTSKPHINVNCDCQCLNTCCCCFMEKCTEPCINTKCTCCCHHHQLSNECNDDDDDASTSSVAAAATPSETPCYFETTSPANAEMASSAFRRCGTLKLCPKSKSVRSVKRKQQKHEKPRNKQENSSIGQVTTGSPSRCKMLLSLASSLNESNVDDAEVKTTMQTTPTTGRTCSSTCPHCCADFENQEDDDIIHETNDDDGDGNDHNVSFEKCDADEDNLDEMNMTS
ncbi:uncharacterized protein LOC142220187 [Haematobia irritans]|uniref:uncharacterized protein LOC142220187 n=1 Tax=Haematobia irritans TaxID=7368 RepID=UPI003F5019BC